MYEIQPELRLFDKVHENYNIFDKISEYPSVRRGMVEIPTNFSEQEIYCSLNNSYSYLMSVIYYN